MYRLNGTEAGAGFELTLEDYGGSTAIVPQDIILFTFVSESGDTEEPGYQLMDAEIAGNVGVELRSNETRTLWKRYAFTDAGEEMKYLSVTTYNDGVPGVIRFALKPDVAAATDARGAER